jgi:hypothetical protein
MVLTTHTDRDIYIYIYIYIERERERERERSNYLKVLAGNLGTGPLRLL